MLHHGARPCAWQVKGFVTLLLLVCPQTALEAAELQTCASLSQTHQAAAVTQSRAFYTTHTPVHNVTSGQQAATAQKNLCFITNSFISPLLLVDSVIDISLPFWTVTCLHRVPKQSQTEVLQI